MRFSRVSLHTAIVCVLALVLSHEALAQRTRPKERKKPFSTMSESAQRLKDSLSTRVSFFGGVITGPVVFAKSQRSAEELQDSLIAVARSQLGTRYRLGAETPGKAFDCSGLIRYVMAALHLELPRTAHEQARAGHEVERKLEALRPGDLLTFGTARRITHIGIYAGDGRVIHASTSKRQVIETSFASLGPKLLNRWHSARRLVAMSDTIEVDGTFISLEPLPPLLERLDR